MNDYRQNLITTNRKLRKENRILWIVLVLTLLAMLCAGCSPEQVESEKPLDIAYTNGGIETEVLVYGINAETGEKLLVTNTVAPDDIVSTDELIDYDCINRIRFDHALNYFDIRAFGTDVTFSGDNHEWLTIGPDPDYTNLVFHADNVPTGTRIRVERGGETNVYCISGAEIVKVAK